MTKFTSELGKEICHRTANSSIGLRHICKELNVPYSTVTSWIYDQDHELHDNYKNAKELQLQFLGDEIMEISDNLTNDFMASAAKNGKSKEVQNRESVARSRLRIHARTVLICKLAPILRARTRHICGKYQYKAPDNEYMDLQDDQDKAAPVAKVKKAVAKQENRAAKNIGGSSPKKTLKRKPGKASISGARSVSAKAAPKKTVKPATGKRSAARKKTTSAKRYPKKAAKPAPVANPYADLPRPKRDFNNPDHSGESVPVTPVYGGHQYRW